MVCVCVCWGVCEYVCVHVFFIFKRKYGAGGVENKPSLSQQHNANAADILLGVIITYKLSDDNFIQNMFISSAQFVLSGRENSSQGEFYLI